MFVLCCVLEEWLCAALLDGVVLFATVKCQVARVSRWPSVAVCKLRFQNYGLSSFFVFDVPCSICNSRFLSFDVPI